MFCLAFYSSAVKGWIVNTKLDNFFKVFPFVLDGTQISQCSVDSDVIEPMRLELIHCICGYKATFPHHPCNSSPRYFAHGEDALFSRHELNDTFREYLKEGLAATNRRQFVAIMQKWIAQLCNGHMMDHETVRIEN
jgi:hypothetical protein